MRIRHGVNTILAGGIAASFLGCSLPTGKYASTVHNHELVTGSNLPPPSGEVDQDVEALSRTTVGVTARTSDGGFGGAH